MPKQIEESVVATDTADLNPWKVKPNYRARLHKLLFIEEAAQQKKITKYDLENTLVKRIPPTDLNTVLRPGQPVEIFSRIEVPGLAEKSMNTLQRCFFASHSSF